MDLLPYPELKEEDRGRTEKEEEVTILINLG
jgi:hypothetical protein